MVEIVSEDVMDWARDLAALRTLIAGEPLADPAITKQATVLQITEYQSQQSMVNGTD